MGVRDIPPHEEVEISNVKLVIYSITGREISVLINEQLNPRSHEVEWNTSNLPDGVYFYKLIAGDYSETRKMILIK